MTRFRSLKVTRVDRLCDDAVAVQFESPDKFAFHPGQSLTVRRAIDGREERRTYSICAPAGGAPRIGVREIPGGLFSSWLVRDVAPGDLVEVAPPSGRFRLVDPTGSHLCVAAGSGITPMLSILGSVLAAGGRVSLVYVNRCSASVMFLDELAAWKDRHGPRFQLVHLLTREPRDADLLSGRPDAERLRRVFTEIAPARSADHAWLCGPLPLVDLVRTTLTALGMPPEAVHTELFFVDEPPPEVLRETFAPTGETSEVTVVLEGRRTTNVVSRDEAVLDGLQHTRADLPFACKGGVCGTCRAKVLSGEVRMLRNHALDDAEVEAGFVLTCQSRPITEQVELDYDC